MADALLAAGAVDEGRGLLRGDDPPAAPERLGLDVLEGQPGLVGDDLATGEGREVLEVRDAPMAEARGPQRDRLQRAVRRVLHEHAEGGAVDLLGEHDQRTRRLHQRVERGHQVVDARDAGLRARHLDELTSRPGPGALVDRAGRIVAEHPGGALGAARLPAPLLPGRRALTSGEHVEVEAVGPDAYVVAHRSRPATVPRGTLRVALLGCERAEVVLNECRLELSRRHSEILALLCTHADGLSSEQLGTGLYGDVVVPSSVRGEVSRLRRLLGGWIETDPYRLAPRRAERRGRRPAAAAPGRRARGGGRLPRRPAPALGGARRRAGARDARPLAAPRRALERRPGVSLDVRRVRRRS